MNNSKIPELNLFPLSDSDPDLRRRPPLQPITIFYNGSVCVSDVTELQARAILLMARRDEEEKSAASPSGSCSSGSESAPVGNPNGLSMKRSLQRFLQKRNDRIQSGFPYSVSRPIKSCSIRRK